MAPMTPMMMGMENEEVAEDALSLFLLLKFHNFFFFKELLLSSTTKPERQDKTDERRSGVGVKIINVGRVNDTKKKHFVSCHGFANLSY